MEQRQKNSSLVKNLIKFVIRTNYLLSKPKEKLQNWTFFVSERLKPTKDHAQLTGSKFKHCSPMKKRKLMYIKSIHKY